MKKILLALTILIATAYFYSCEKDDICVEGDTPLMIITFYDKDDHTLAKAVEGLSATAEDKTTLLPIAKTDSIAVPLLTIQDNISFTLVENTASEDAAKPENKDVVVFNYTTKETFVSRACGYITTYTALSTTFADSPDNWIDSIEIVNTTVENQIAAHVKIYH